MPQHSKNHDNITVEEQEEQTMHDGAPANTDADNGPTGLKITPPKGWIRLSLAEPNAKADVDPSPLYIRRLDIRAVTPHVPEISFPTASDDGSYTRIDTPQGSYMVREDPEDILGQIQQSPSEKLTH